MNILSDQASNRYDSFLGQLSLHDYLYSNAIDENSVCIISFRCSEHCTVVVVYYRGK